jgi:threonine synthase
MSKSPFLHRSVTVRVPATTANMGPGFDCVGMALNLFNELRIRTDVEDTKWFIEGEGKDYLPRDDSNLIVRGLKLAFREANIHTMPNLHFHILNRIPIGAGLGSSSAAIVSGLLAGLALTGIQLAVEREEKALQLASQIEGHVDNLAPCIYGGLQVGVYTENRWYTTNINVPNGLQCIVFTPDVRQETEACRRILSPSLSRSEAIYNLGRVALLINCFASNNFDDLRIATEDALHQPQRETIMPALRPCINAALAAGAKGAFLSGAGSSIMAITSGRKGDIYGQRASERKDVLVARAMQRAAMEVGMKGKLMILNPSTLGAHVTEIDDDPSLVTSGSALYSIPEDASTTINDNSSSTFLYISTRDEGKKHPVSFSRAVLDGIAPDGGLYVPMHFPEGFSASELLEMANTPELMYSEVAYRVLRRYIGEEDLSSFELRTLVDKTYATSAPTSVWASKIVCPLKKSGDLYFLEQFHGPTCAFKDLALQLLGNLFEFLLKRDSDVSGEQKRVTIVGATSGDTGSAAISALRGKANISVFILHPKNRVAKVQEMQMTSVLDKNVFNLAVEGSGDDSSSNFDECQGIVKQVFADKSFKEKFSLSAINSINWARILAQIVYSVHAYIQFLQIQLRKPGSVSSEYPLPSVTFVVPTGNFGNALSCYYAKRLGIPIKKICCSTNQNDIIHRFISCGDYSQKSVVPTLAPSMDIQAASNLERYLFVLANEDATCLNQFMTEIGSSEKRLKSVSKEQFSRLKEDFVSFTSSDDRINQTIKKFLDLPSKDSYALCPHTATGADAALSLFSSGLESGSEHVIVMATAHPAKFASDTPALQHLYKSVLNPSASEDVSQEPAVPPQLMNLVTKPRRCTNIPNKTDVVKEFIRTVL